jgi:FMN phosphatase YigB (HAD superfamily)
VNSDFTLAQIAQLRFSRRPLVICDVDEVVVHFTRELEAHLDARGFYLATDSFALNGNVRRKDDHSPLETAEVMSHIDDVFAQRTLHMEPIDGAIDALLAFGARADVVLLTNLPHEAGDMRRNNMAGLGLPYPVVTNSGPKGPAIRRLADLAGATTVFIDDSPGFIASAHAHAPDVHLVHFLHDERFARHLAPVDYVSLRTDNWAEVRPHVLGLIG